MSEKIEFISLRELIRSVEEGREVHIFVGGEDVRVTSIKITINDTRCSIAFIRSTGKRGLVSPYLDSTIAIVEDWTVWAW